MKKIAVFALILVTVMLVTAFVLARIFEDELTQYVLDGLNRQIRTEVRVDNINLSFIKKFPDASLEFKNVFMASVPDFDPTVFGEIDTDTLLVARQLFLRFNLFKLVKRKYIIKEVQVQSGELNIFIDRKGSGNYIFWAKKEVPGKSFLLALENVKLSDMLVRFDNRALEIDVRGIVGRSSFKGEFSRESYIMSAGLDGELIHYSNRGTVFIKDQKISSNASLHIDPQSIKISEGNLGLAGQQMLVSGSILRPKPLDLDLHIEGRQLDLEQVLKHFLLLSEKYPKDLRAGGKLDFRGQIRGVVSNTRMPEIEADFSLKEGWLRASQLLWEIREIRTEGSYSNGLIKGPETSVISLSDMSMKFGNSRIGGNYSVSNLISPTFNYLIKTDLDLSDIQNIKAVASIFSKLQGRVLAEIRMDGKQALLKDLKKEDLLNYKYQANFHLEDVTLSSPRIPLELENFSGDAVFTDHLQVKSLSGEVEKSQVSISGRADNFLEYLVTPEGNLWMDIDLYSERLDLNHLRSLNINADLEPTHKSRSSDPVSLPERLYLKTRFWFDELEIKNFSASNVTGNLIYIPKRLSINRIELSSMDGNIRSEGMLEQRADMSFLVKAMSEINSVDITMAFTSFNNFGQEFILDSHLKGSLSGEVNFSAGLDTRMKIKKETILADCDIVIKNGELSGFEPMMTLSKYIDLEELENISFSTLTNEIFIRNEEILIPKMDIHSSAVDITASGIHGFDKEFSYKIKLALSDILAKKSRNRDIQASEFGIIEDDGLGRMYIYLIIEGSPDGTDIRYDRKGAVQNIRDQMYEEKKELKQILNEEFGFFKKDSTLINEAERLDAPEFIIEWEEDSIPPGIEKPGNKTEKEKFIIEWDEDENETQDSIPEIKTKRRKKKI